ncbi:MAG: hypothetical protein WBA97_02930 [Actinophytocola sp.]|uniref:hypothetical protein n=1 Tax=Actinophytocola sp. TaxID=1872138 RepID=UPI003C720AA1
MSYPNQALPREFRMAGGGFGRMALPFVLLLIFFAVVMLMLGSVFAGLLGGVIAAVIGTGALVGVLYKKFERMRQGTVVRFSEYGVELSDTLGYHIRLNWPDITRIGEVRSQMVNPTAIGAAGGVRVGAGAVRTQGIIGWGHRVIPQNAPAWMRYNVAAASVNPHDGRSEVAIPLSGIDPNWLQGAMGQWLRMYRPDLLDGPYGYPPR